MSSARTVWIACLVVLGAYGSARGELRNVQLVPLVETVDLADALTQAGRRAPEGAWLGYTVPLIDGAGFLCCHDGSWGHGDESCRLGDDRHSFHESDRVGPPRRVGLAWCCLARGAASPRGCHRLDRRRGCPSRDRSAGSRQDP